MDTIKLLLFLSCTSLAFSQEVGTKNYVVFIDQKQATAFADKLSSDLGFPKEGVNVGGGRHVSREQGMTQKFSVPVKHPKEDKWAVAVSGVESLAKDVIPEKLTVDWKPTDAVVDAKSLP